MEQSGTLSEWHRYNSYILVPDLPFLNRHISWTFSKSSESVDCEFDDMSYRFIQLDAGTVKPTYIIQIHKYEFNSDLSQVNALLMTYPHV